VIYGRHNAPQSLEINLKDIERVIQHSASENVLVDLDVTGDGRPKRLALVQEVQHHALSGAVLHLDFHEVVENESVTITVPLESVGEAVGVKTGGGVLEHVVFKLRVRALPKDLPEVIRVDVSSLEIGSSIHLGEVPVPQGVEILGDKKIVVLSVAAPVTEAEETAEAAAEGAVQPEMIKEKKEDGAAPAAADKGGDKKAGDKKAPEKKAPEKKK
jgi:large subunit ribosomal protein L25